MLIALPHPKIKCAIAKFVVVSSEVHSLSNMWITRVGISEMKNHVDIRRQDENVFYSNRNMIKGLNQGAYIRGVATPLVLLIDV